ncbi:hypothetical protein [Paenibacillus sp. SI8]|uniref:hypothetical protein n=1 Tax=unclassified Paenibacillus TaxID=185978 RepID=UPI003467168D
MMKLSNAHQRKLEIISKIAAQAYEQPLLGSGLMFLQDIRDNFYYASYLFEASQHPAILFPYDRAAAKAKAEHILQEVLNLQDQEPVSPTYGHWPLQLRPTPQEAPMNTLPVELMGSLMVFFYQCNKENLGETLSKSFENAILHIYRSHFYRKPLEHFNHHEAKYTAAKLILGQFYEDKALLKDGLESLQGTLDRVTAIGMSEYGALPWFWHWVQAFTCAWELMENSEIKAVLGQMLDYLWGVRSTYYLKGTWVGPHSRGWPHDIPQDKNVLLDYVQYGDFTLPDEMPRTEYAGLLFYEAPSSFKAIALERSIPAEVKRIVSRPAALAKYGGELLHSYVHITENYAIGGMWERQLEFDNEQHRWDVTLPLDAVEGVNRAFFFHPGERYADGDSRHQSEYEHVLLHQNVVAALYQIPAEQPDEIVGCLPPGEWIEDQGALFGHCGKAFIAVYVNRPYQREVLSDRSVVKSRGRTNAVVVECIDAASALVKGITDLRQFAARMTRKRPAFDQSSAGNYELTYFTLQDEVLALAIDEKLNIDRFVNGKAVDFHDYTVNESQ